MTSTRFAVCDVTIDVVGESRFADSVTQALRDAHASEATSTDATANSPADITLNVSGAAPAVTVKRTERSRRLPYQFDTAVTTAGVRYQMRTFRNNLLYTVDLNGLPYRDHGWAATATLPAVGLSRFLPSPVIRALTREHASTTAYFTAVAVNEVLEPLLWTQLLERNRTVIHAAACVTPDGRGIAFTGAGQVGKTSLALGLVRRHGWRYLADDHVILNPDEVVRMPRPVRLAAHHLAILADVDKISGMAHTKRQSRARRRVALHDVIDPQLIASSAPLSVLVDVAATPPDTALRQRAVSRSAVVSQVTAAVISDFWEFLAFMNAAAALAGCAAANEWHQRVTEVVEASLPPTVLGIDIPIGTDLNAAAAFVADTLA